MSHTLIKLGYIAAGGAIGAVLRYGASGLAYRWLGDGFPWGTLAVNMIGSFLIGLIYQVSQAISVSPNVRLLTMVGLLGAFTTFSTFSLETLNLITKRLFAAAAWNILASVGAGLLLALLGIEVGRLLLGPGR